MKKQTGLGRGLGALIGDAQTEFIEDPKSTKEIDINLIDVCPSQPRKTFDEDKLQELARSIDKFGVIQPLVVKKSGNRYVIIAGERRYRASRIAGLKKIPVIVKDMDDKDILQVSIIENIQREDLNPMEEAMAVAVLMERYGFTQERVSEGIGKSRSAVANTLRLLSLPQDVKELVSDGKLSGGHARTLLPLKDEKKITEAATYVIEKDLSVRQTEEYVKRLLEEKHKEPETKSPITSEMRAAGKQLSERFDTKVQITGAEDKGKIIIEYYSKEQLMRLFDNLIK